jgi:hypothetical protein
MPDAVSIDTSRVTAVLDRVIALDGSVAFESIAMQASRVAGVRAEEAVGEYPPPKRAPMPLKYTWADGRRSKFKSLAHQRGFFYLLRAGKIQIPYKRRGRLGASITSEPYVRGRDTGFLIGTNIAYNLLVLGTPKQGQALYHQNHWTPLIERLQREKDAIVSVWAEELLGGIRSYVLND